MMKESSMFKFAAIFAAALCVSTGAVAQTYPNKPITLVVPFAAGVLSI
jgi:tripartite-type tricarboxylate transporter receptor subunit TctC